MAQKGIKAAIQYVISEMMDQIMDKVLPDGVCNPVRNVFRLPLRADIGGVAWQPGADTPGCVLSPLCGFSFPGRSLGIGT